MQYNFSGSFHKVEVFAASIENWISKLYVQEFLKQSQKKINSLSFRIKEKLNILNEKIFKQQLDKLLVYSHHFTNIGYKNTIHLSLNKLKGYVYIYVEDNIKKYIKHEKNYSGLFYGSYLDDARAGWIGNIYINLTIKQDIENYISNCHKIDLLFMIKCRINYFIRVVKHEVLQKIAQERCHAFRLAYELR